MREISCLTVGIGPENVSRWLLKVRNLLMRGAKIFSQFSLSNIYTNKKASQNEIEKKI